MKRNMLIAIVMTIALMASSIVQAQNNGGQGQGGFQGQGRGQGQQGQGGFGRGGGIDPTQIRSQMSNQIKEQLGATDEEWMVLGPKVEKVQLLQSELGQGPLGTLRTFMRGGFGGLGGRRGGGFGGGGGGGQGGALGGMDMSALFGPDSSLQKRIQALQEALNNKEMPEGEIRVRLAAVREERERVRVELNKARAELIELLTPRQEATLFTSGMLE